MHPLNILLGFLFLFLLYQLAEANGQDLIRLPGKPYSILLLYLLVIPAAYFVARWQGDDGLASYGMGMNGGWWRDYLFGLGLGAAAQAILEAIGVRLGVRTISNPHFSLRALAGGLAWILLTNFPAAAAEDLVTRGYLWRFMQASPLAVFVLFSALVYTLNHILRLLTRPVTDWYHLPFLGLTLAYALFQTGSLWLVIGLHQAGNLILPLMRQMMDVTNTTDIKKRIGYGILSELAVLGIVILVLRFIRL